MIQICQFNPRVDVRETDQFGFVDLHSALETGKIPASVPASESSFDFPAGTMVSPSCIGGVPSDVFDAMEMRDAARAAGSKKSGSDSGAAAKQPAATAPAATDTE